MYVELRPAGYSDYAAVAALHTLSWRENYQGSGIGKRLMRACADIIEHAAESDQMYLWVYEINTKAAQAYQHLGGKLFELMEQPLADGNQAPAFRCCWADVADYFLN